MCRSVVYIIALLVVYFQCCNSSPIYETESLVISSIAPPKDETGTKEGVIPEQPKIYEMSVDTNVTYRFLTTRITNKVKNLASHAQETTFGVVLPETAYISGFVMEIDNQSYEAFVKGKEEASNIYNKAVESGQAAALVEVNARDSNKFMVSVNIAPQSTATFKLTYEELLQRRNEQYEIVLNIHPGQLVDVLKIQVNINDSQPLKFVKTPPLRSGNIISTNGDDLDSHAEIQQISPQSAVIKFNPNQERQKQLAHRLGTKEEHGLSGQFVVTYDVERDSQGGEILVNNGYFVHFFAPSKLEALPKHVVFVLDTSGSMSGEKIEQLQVAMNKILSELKSEDVFNIVEFSWGVKVWDIEQIRVAYERGSMYGSQLGTPETNILPPAYAVNKSTINKAKQVVATFEGNGGTDILCALETALQLVQKHKEKNQTSHQPLIIFLTDGEPTVGETLTDRIITAVKYLNSGEFQSPIFSLSFGADADRDLLLKLSLRNFGFERHIYEASDASLQLQDFYHEISTALLSNVTFNYILNMTKVTKTAFPIYFKGGEIIVAGQGANIDPNASPCSISGQGRSGFIELKPIVQNSIGNLERLWAYLTIKQILEKRRTTDDDTSYTKKAVDIALKYSLVTPVTSLIVVKPNETVSVNLENALPVAPIIYGGYNSPMALPMASAVKFKPPSSVLQNLKYMLPWLDNTLDQYGYLTSLEGTHYKLGTDEVLNEIECPKTPLNGTTGGTCTLLSECNQVYPLLTEAKIFLEHACYVNNVAGICCPK